MQRFRRTTILFLALVLRASGFILTTPPQSALTASVQPTPAQKVKVVQVAPPLRRASGLSVMAASPRQPGDKDDGELEEKGGIEPK